MIEIITERYLHLLVEQFLYDLTVMSKGWMYYLVFPILTYLHFFITKWLILTFPIWIVTSAIFGTFDSILNGYKRTSKIIWGTIVIIVFIVICLIMIIAGASQDEIDEFGESIKGIFT